MKLKTFNFKVSAFWSQWRYNYQIQFSLSLYHKNQRSEKKYWKLGELKKLSQPFWIFFKVASMGQILMIILVYSKGVSIGLGNCVLKMDGLYWNICSKNKLNNFIHSFTIWVMIADVITWWFFPALIMVGTIHY